MRACGGGVECALLQKSYIVLFDSTWSKHASWKAWAFSLMLVEPPSKQVSPGQGQRVKGRVRGERDEWVWGGWIRAAMWSSPREDRICGASAVISKTFSWTWSCRTTWTCSSDIVGAGLSGPITAGATKGQMDKCPLTLMRPPAAQNTIWDAT